MPSRACPLTARCGLDAQPSSGLQHRACSAGSGPVERCMAERTEPVDDLLDALVWMRRKAKRHEAVDDLIDALMKMRRKAKKKLANRQLSTNRKHSTNRKRSAKKRTKP